MTMTHRKYRTVCLTIGLLALIFTGYASAAPGPKQTIGAVIGAAAGGALGSQFGGNDRDGRRNYNRGNQGRKYVQPRYDRRQPDRKRYARWRNDNRRIVNPSYYRRNDYNRRIVNPNYYRRNNYNWNYYRRGDNSTQLVATAMGVFIGALIGSEIGRYMDDVDRLNAIEANARARTAPVGTQITWNNPQSNNYGSITATRDGYSESGKYCREFYQTVSIGGRTENAYGVACRQPDGAWQIVQSLR